ncbi:MAG: response regulator, partial [Acidobacteriota bacterium]
MTTTPLDPSAPLRALIVDDEPLARDLLRQLLEPFPDIVLVGEARDGLEALQQLRAQRPDLIFLDIRMPGLGGFEVLKALGGDNSLPTGHVIFVTAFDEYAVRAFEVEAADYLLKPVERPRLARAVERVRRRRGERHNGSGTLRSVLERLDAMESRRASSSFPERIPLRHGERTALVPVAEIRRLEAHRKKVRIYARDRIHEVRDSL